MDLHLTEQLAEACRYAFTAKRRDRPKGVEFEQTFSGAFAHTSNAVWLKFPTHCVLAFQGTLDGHDRAGFYEWLCNVRMNAAENLELPGRVHTGFARQLRPILPAILEKLRTVAEKPATKDLPLYLTGHSQGGALALLMTKLLEKEEIVVTRTCTFGAPRCGDRDFVRSLSTPVERYEFGRDLVPHVPFRRPDSFAFRFAWSKLKHHLPEEAAKLLDDLKENVAVYESAGALYYAADSDGKFESLSAKEEKELYWKRCVALMTAGNRLVDDHDMTNYLKTARRA